MPLGAFLQEDLFYVPGTAVPSEYSPAKLVVYVIELRIHGKRRTDAGVHPTNRQIVVLPTFEVN